MSLAEKNTIKSNLLFKSNEKILLYVGRLDENKGGKELINAFKLLLIEEPDCRLVIIGNGDESIYFEQMQMYWSKIIFSGRLPKELIYKFYQIADVGILPSFAEQCSYVAIEMMMHGLPIVGTDSTGLSEMIIDGENGYKVNLNENENDVFLESLSKAINIVTTNPLAKINIRPFFNGSNMAFFKENVFMDLNDLLSSPISKKSIFRHQVLNENFFGKMIIMPNGETYSNINHNSLGNAFDDILSINKLVYKEMRHGKAWFKVRDEIPCKNCCNKSLCPSPSNYEIVTNRVNLCNIKK